MSTIIGPRDPAVETRDEYIARIVRNAGRPTPEEYARLAALLGMTARAERVEIAKPQPGKGIRPERSPVEGDGRG